MNTQEIFNKKASDSTKRFSVEAFCFTHSFGLNIHFDGMDDLKDITKDVEFEFWLLNDGNSSAEVSVSEWTSLEKMVASLENLDCDSSEEIDAYIALVEHGVSADLEQAKEFYENCFRCDFVSNVDFGYYLIDELEIVSIPEHIQNYFDYEKYGREMLISGYFLCKGKVYANS